VSDSDDGNRIRVSFANRAVVLPLPADTYPRSEFRRPVAWRRITAKILWEVTNLLRAVLESPAGLWLAAPVELLRAALAMRRSIPPESGRAPTVVHQLHRIPHRLPAAMTRKCLRYNGFQKPLRIPPHPLSALVAMPCVSPGITKTVRLEGFANCSCDSRHVFLYGSAPMGRSYVHSHSLPNAS
jgi:hypothetical protein